MLGWNGTVFRTRSPRLALVAIGLACCTLFASCEKKPEGPPTVPVKGTVTYKGQPVSGASVVFYPSDGSESIKPVQAVTGDDGTYQVKTLVADGVYKEGMQVGDYEVTVSKTEPQPPGVMMPPKELMPVKYTAPQTSPFQVQVTNAGGDFPLELK